MAIEFIKYEDIETKITKKGIEIINFYADWCGSCKMFTPVLEELSSEYKVFKINIDNNKNNITNEEIQGIPYTKILKDGKVFEKINGYVSKERMIEIIKK